MGHPDDPRTDWVGAPPDAGVAWVDGSRADTRVPPKGPAPRLPPLHDRRRTRRRRQGPALLDAVPIVAIAVAVAGLATLEHLSRRSLARAVAQAEADEGDASRALVLHERRLALQADAVQRVIAFRTLQRRAVSMSCESGTWCEDRLRRIDRSLRLVRPLALERAPDPQVAAPLDGLRQERRALEEDLAALAPSGDPDAERRRAVLMAEREAFESAGLAP